MSDVCGTCGNPENFPEDSKSELRPYGPGGEFICFRCAFATPETTSRAKNAFGALLEAAEAPTGVAVIGTKDGPMVFNPPSVVVPTTEEKP